MATPIEQLSSLVVGTVESVSPKEVRVLLELDAPHATALNAGKPTAFPRFNGYVLVPSEAGATAAYIAWIGIEPSPYPKRTGLKDFCLIDLPFPLRRMTVSPVGTLTSRRGRESGAAKYELARGVAAFPSVGDEVLIPTPEQVEAIVGVKASDKRVRIGASPMASNAAIMVDPDKLFGLHLAVLGNTGSGKSCTLAGLIRWSMEAAAKSIRDAGKTGVPNGRVIVLDPNGEYAKAFADQGDNLRLFRVPPVAVGERPLAVPAWLWSGHEWTAVAHAQPGAQRPLLMQGLRQLKSGQMEGVPREAMIRRYLVCYSTRLSVYCQKTRPRWTHRIMPLGGNSNGEARRLVFRTESSLRREARAASAIGSPSPGDSGAGCNEFHRTSGLPEDGSHPGESAAPCTRFATSTQARLNAKDNGWAGVLY